MVALAARELVWTYRSNGQVMTLCSPQFQLECSTEAWYVTWSIAAFFLDHMTCYWSSVLILNCSNTAIRLRNWPDNCILDSRHIHLALHHTLDSCSAWFQTASTEIQHIFSDYTWLTITGRAYNCFDDVSSITHWFTAYIPVGCMNALSGHSYKLIQAHPLAH